MKKMSAKEPDIHFVGFVSGVEKEELLTNALVFVLPSSLEGFPIALLEAKSCGLFCLVSDISPHREAIREGREGLFFRAGDVADLASKLLSALEDKEGPSLMKRKAGEKTRKAGLWAEACAQTERVYQEVLGRPIK